MSEGMRETGIQFYDKKGKLIDEHGYLLLQKDTTYRQVADTFFECPSGEARVSTIWLGIDHGFMDQDAPLIFETMVFCECPEESQYRYATEDHAKRGHEQAIVIHRGWMDLVLVDAEWKLVP